MNRVSEKEQYSGREEVMPKITIDERVIENSSEVHLMEAIEELKQGRAEFIIIEQSEYQALQTCRGEQGWHIERLAYSKSDSDGKIVFDKSRTQVIDEVSDEDFVRILRAFHRGDNSVFAGMDMKPMPDPEPSNQSTVEKNRGRFQMVVLFLLITIVAIVKLYQYFANGH